MPKQSEVVDDRKLYNTEAENTILLSNTLEIKQVHALIRKRWIFLSTISLQIDANASLGVFPWHSFHINSPDSNDTLSYI